MTGVEEMRVVSTERLRQPRHRACLGRRYEQVGVIPRPDARVKSTPVAPQSVLQSVQIPSAIIVVEEARQAIVAALHDVLRDPGDVGARRRAMPGLSHRHDPH